VDFWLKSHIERVLEPLFRLAAADDVTGMARGIAYQLIEGLGVLERQKVAEEIKGLDQASRATLRKYGVRFGAYHIFLPVLLKPGARVLATQLWALKHENGPETKGAEAVLELAGSGRTSIAADKDCARVLFRVAGYRICGARAVRVDILERLADLIRSALAWRAGAAGAKPPGAVDGFGFAVTVSMTSLAGCAGEDFASILQSLGYQMEKRPRPPAPVAEPASDLSAEAAGTAELPSSEQIAIRLDASASGGEEIRADPPSALNDLPNVGAEISEPGPSGTESATLAPAAPEPSQAPVAENVNGADETAPSQSAGIATTQDGALELIEVWRPVRRGGQRNARREHSSRRRQRAERPEMPSRPVPANHELGVDDSAIATEPATAAATATEVALSPENDGVASAHARRKGHRRRDHAPAEAPEGTAQRRSPRRARRAPKETTEPIDRGTPSVVAERPRREPRGDRPDRDPALRAKYIKGKGAWGASREPDPDSPFAKLAKLKEQLEANAKSSR
jgi:ATP-dependent RNA helicase SUPV3L1/SUV3